MSKGTWVTTMVFVFVVVTLSMDNAYAAQIEVSIPSGVSSPGCENINSCYLPFEAMIATGDIIQWTNNDFAPHTVTSGTPGGGPNGLFDSGVIPSSGTFSHIFSVSGTANYFCQIHPWMTGLVTVAGVNPLQQILSAIQTLQNTIINIGTALQGEIQARQTGDVNLQNQIDGLGFQIFGTYQLVNSVTINPGETLDESISCEVGDLAFGGGYEFGTKEVSAKLSQPSGHPPTGWRVVAFNDVSGVQTFFDVYVVCGATTP